MSCNQSVGAQATSPHFHPVHADIASPEGAAALEKAALELLQGKIDHVISSVGAWCVSSHTHTYRHTH